MLFSSLSNLKKTLWTKFHKVVIEIGRLIDQTPSKRIHEKRPRTPEYHYRICKIHYATKQCNQVIKNTGLIDGTPSKMGNFHNQMAKSPGDTGVIRTIIELEEDNILLNNMTKFHKVLIKTIRLRERALG